MGSGQGTGRYSRATRYAGTAAVVLIVVAVPTQAALVACTARTQLSEPHAHHIRSLLEAAARRIPAGSTYAITSAERTPNAVYLLRHQHVAAVKLTGPASTVRMRLQNAGIRYVIVPYANRPRAFADGASATWYRVIVQERAGDVVELIG